MIESEHHNVRLAHLQADAALPTGFSRVVPEPKIRQAQSPRNSYGPRPGRWSEWSSEHSAHSRFGELSGTGRRSTTTLPVPGRATDPLRCPPGFTADAIQGRGGRSGPWFPSDPAETEPVGAYGVGGIPNGLGEADVAHLAVVGVQYAQPSCVVRQANGRFGSSDRRRGRCRAEVASGRAYHYNPGARPGG